VRWLLDTNIVIALSKQVPALLPWLQRCPASELVLSSVVLAEVEYGIAKSERQAHNRKVFDALLGRFEVLPFDADAAREYGVIRAALERIGRPIGPNDLLIAAHARSKRLTLVTDNTSEFARVDGLSIENWLAAPPA
jgi:tRNA(fMet)-specific endonuclease VapC